MTTILGVSGLYHDSAAAVVRGGDILGAVQEERFTRRKADHRLPVHSIAWCLERAGGADSIDAIAFYEDPVLSLDRVIKNAVEKAPDSKDVWANAVVSQLAQKINAPLDLGGVVNSPTKKKLFVVDHHRSHAASAFFPSPFTEAAIVVLDGIGEWASSTIAFGRDTTIELRRQIHYPHSLGLFYSAFTHHCGLKVNSGEYKLMGLAPYGEPRYVDLIMDNMLDLREDGSFRLNTEYFGYLTTGFATNSAFEDLLGSARRDPEGVITTEYMDIAASAQAVIEEAMLRIARHALAMTGSRNLCLAGGVALNCVSNGKLLRHLPELSDIWIQPASGDAGGALGAALQIAHQYYGLPRHANVGHGDGQKGSLLGPSYTRDEIVAAMREANLVWHEVDDPLRHDDIVAEVLAQGMIVGRFDGPMEYGPRALGNRSILADPRRPDGQTHINLRIKFRESWRPFAPIVLAEHCADYFELKHESPYMLLVAGVRAGRCRPIDWSGFRDGDHNMFKVLNQARSDLPAITHVDYSARVQTVELDAESVVLPIFDPIP